MTSGGPEREHHGHDHPRPLPPVPALSRRRAKRLRRALAPQRERVRRSLRTTLQAQQRALRTRPTDPPPVAGAATLARTFGDLERDLRRRAGGDAQIVAAARGVGALAEAYRDLAAAAQTDDLQAAARLTRRSVAALRRAEKERGRARDAWPL